MSGWVLFIKLLLVHYTTQSITETRINCYEDVSLKCPGVDSDSMRFLSLSWYKLDGQNKPQGIIRRLKGIETPQNYNFSRPATFGRNFSLLLQKVTPEDSGSYQCSISANVGRQNQDHKVELIVNVCVTEANLTTPTNVLNTTQPDLLCQKQVEDLPVMWTVIGYVAVGLSKIILSLISIWVIRAVSSRSSRQRQHRW